MGIKISGFEFESAKPQGRGGKQKIDADVALMTKASTSTKRPVFTVRVTISNKLAKEARLRYGDRVDLLFDRKNMAGAILRSDDGQYALTGSMANGRLEVKTTWRDGDNIPTTADIAKCCGEATSQGIVFMLPDTVSFTDNLIRLPGQDRK
jgi:hypothetical protein